MLLCIKLAKLNFKCTKGPILNTITQSKVQILTLTHSEKTLTHMHTYIRQNKQRNVKVPHPPLILLLSFVLTRVINMC